MSTATQERIYTPKEMADLAYKRIISIGEAVVKLNGWKHEYNQGKNYFFKFDKLSIYLFNRYDGKLYHFDRVGGGSLFMTKYAEPPQHYDYGTTKA